MERFWSKVDRRGDDECWEWQASRGPDGYGFFWCSDHNERAHRVALELHLGRPLREGYLACHTCDNPPCCNPNHLFEGTHDDNMADKAAKGRAPKTTGNTRIPDATVEEARRLYETKQYSQRRIADLLGISQSQVGNIVRGDQRV